MGNFVIIAGEMRDVDYTRVYGPYSTEDEAEQAAEALVESGVITLDYDDGLEYRIVPLIMNPSAPVAADGSGDDDGLDEFESDEDSGEILNRENLPDGPILGEGFDLESIDKGMNDFLTTMNSWHEQFTSEAARSPQSDFDTFAERLPSFLQELDEKIASGVSEDEAEAELRLKFFESLNIDELTFRLYTGIGIAALKKASEESSAKD